MTAYPKPYRFTSDQFHRMAEIGLLKKDQRVELIDGEVVYMSLVSKRQAGVVNRVVALLHRLLGEDAIVAVQNPMSVAKYTEAYPDIAALALRDDYYASELPTPADARLIIEVADTSLAYDRDVKVPLYAHGGVPEVWVVDLNGDVVHVYRKPEEGAYTEARTLTRGDTLPLPGTPGAVVKVEDILG
ncbi:MAG TPA: Uma2 family endonuclease [Chloroflexia bacterium]|nr:Uma2 family endonuclease [Chloroflexia bacterium]